MHYTYPHWMILLIKRYHLSMCLDCLWDRGSFVCATTPLLLQQSSIGLAILGNTKIRSQTSWFILLLLPHLTNYAFRLSCRINYNTLLKAHLTEYTIIQTKNKSWLRFKIISVCLKTSINVSFYNELLFMFINQ